MTRGQARMVLVSVLALVVAAVVTVDARAWLRAYVTAYSTRENLTGCRTVAGRRACFTACGHPWAELHDWQFTVAAHPRLGLRCGQRIEVCGKGCQRATVTDVTLSRFDFELSRALALATGANRFAWDAPRLVIWRTV